VKYLIILAIFMTFGSPSAQISQSFSIDLKKTFSPGKPFTATISFEELPTPEKLTKVNYILEVAREFQNPQDVKRDWEIELYYFDNAVEIVGDTQFTWPGPHTKGSTYSGSFGFRPLRSGLWHLTFDFKGCCGSIMPNNCVTFQWCFDEDGILRRLGQPEHKDHEECDYRKVTFFHEDSIILENSYEYAGYYPFDYRIIIKPIPRVGDTAIINYYLKANGDIDERGEVALESFGFKLPFPPNRFSLPIYKDQELKYALKVVPKNLGGVLKLQLDFNYMSPTANRHEAQNINLDMVLDSEGKLKYVSDIDLLLLSKEKMASNLPGGKFRENYIRMDIHTDEDHINQQWQLLKKMEGKDK
jgi:hypothetical protein